jgi:hypothetical protein
MMQRLTPARCGCAAAVEARTAVLMFDLDFPEF